MQFTKRAFNFRSSKSYRVPYRSRTYSKKFKFNSFNRTNRKNRGYFRDSLFGYMRMRF